MTIADQRRINYLEHELAAAVASHALVVEEATARLRDLVAAQERVVALERQIEAMGNAPDTWRSVRPVRARISERILLHPDERIVNTQPIEGNSVIVWVECERPAPPTQEEADRTPEGERAVTEEVARA